MKELISLPTSIRTRIEHENALAQRDSVQPTQNALQTVGVELAKSHPELCTLAMAAHLGYHELSSVEQDTHTSYRRVAHKFLGIEVGESWVPIQTQRVIRKQWRLS